MNFGMSNTYRPVIYSCFAYIDLNSEQMKKAKQKKTEKQEKIVLF